MNRHPSSFRDPNGFVFEKDGEIFRGITSGYLKHYETLKSSGLFGALVKESLLVSHTEVQRHLSNDDEPLLVIKPEQLPFVTYPYEWSFGQLKEAALTTLRVLELALSHGMIIKDASAFNIQFKGPRTVFIDTLSFDEYVEGQAWNGYRQFCQHFLAPLCIARFLGPDFLSLWKLSLEGVPLAMASKILPLKSWFSLTAVMHIHLHAGAIAQYGTGSKKVLKTHVSKQNLLALIDNLKGYIGGLSLRKSHRTQWDAYESEVHYSEQAKNAKARIVQEWVQRVSPSVVFDIGANTGIYSRLIAGEGRMVVSIDADPVSVDRNFHQAQKENIQGLYSLLADVTDLTSGRGWANNERAALTDRCKPDMIMALGLIHHLVISNNIPFDLVAKRFSELARWAIVEFIPPDDAKSSPCQTMLASNCTAKNFEAGFFSFFEIVEERQISDSARTMLLMSRRK